ncbi:MULTISPECIES: hypothetical protein [unclassified Bacillus (in: firmicutes)]|uniref:hypothetical protein n=1 Tax=unclassified Bacillus (in: firmicutes) TaxID=185979 RepID=UPI0008EC1AAF|nr:MULTISPECIES: hypothetical protein [unclassified Bacillus (in: firmicutes)]PGZ93536.1 hypothetical protein COE53_06055 [Bacillus sp. AFS029533]SFC19821.1 hypothetical protein SAMN02799633_00058 [Bacillus sp. UNCCL81]
MRKNFSILMLTFLLFLVIGCEKNNNEDIQAIAYASLTRTEQAALSDKHGVVKKVESIPNQATLFNKNYHKDKLYSVTFNGDNPEEKIVIYIDTETNKKVGMIGGE